jgi:hypothetical protein
MLIILISIRWLVYPAYTPIHNRNFIIKFARNAYFADPVAARSEARALIARTLDRGF